MAFRLAWFSIKKNLLFSILFIAEISIAIITLASALNDAEQRKFYKSYKGDLENACYFENSSATGFSDYPNLSVEQAGAEYEGKELGFAYSSSAFVDGKPARCELLSENLAKNVVFNGSVGGLTDFEEGAPVMLGRDFEDEYEIGQPITVTFGNREIDGVVRGYLGRFGRGLTDSLYGETDAVIAADFDGGDVPREIYVFGIGATELTDKNYFPVQTYIIEEPQAATVVCAFICAMAFVGITGVSLLTLPKTRKRYAAQAVLGASRGRLAAAAVIEKTSIYSVAAVISIIAVNCAFWFSFQESIIGAAAVLALYSPAIISEAVVAAKTKTCSEEKRNRK